MKSKFDKILNFVKEFIVQIQIMFSNLVGIYYFMRPIMVKSKFDLKILT